MGSFVGIIGDVERILVALVHGTEIEFARAASDWDDFPVLAGEVAAASDVQVVAGNDVERPQWAVIAVGKAEVSGRDRCCRWREPVLCYKDALRHAG